jgi:hypothetical protein
MPTLTLNDREFDEVRGLVQHAIDSANEDATNTGKYPHWQDRAYAWEYTALLAGVLAAFARAEEVSDAVRTA